MHFNLLQKCVYTYTYICMNVCKVGVLLILPTSYQCILISPIILNILKMYQRFIKQILFNKTCTYVCSCTQYICTNAIAGFTIQTDSINSMYLSINDCFRGILIIFKFIKDLILYIFYDFKNRLLLYLYLIFIPCGFI